MSLSDFLTTLNIDKISPEKGFYSSHLGSKIKYMPDAFAAIDEDTDIVLIGVQDDATVLTMPAALMAPTSSAKSFTA